MLLCFRYNCTSNQNEDNLNSRFKTIFELFESCCVLTATAHNGLNHMVHDILSGQCRIIEFDSTKKAISIERVRKCQNIDSYRPE